MDRRAAGALLALAACIACSAAAPTASNHTALDLYEGASEGCYYNFQHYGEGDRIMTNEPCLNCTCHNRMLMCYLRVCPFTKPIGQDCTVEKRADQCCPIVTCPDVPVDLLTSTSTTSPAEYGATGLGRLDKYGCSISGKYFPEGSKVPPTPNKPCEHCYCIRNMTTCVMQECTLHVDGCTPIYHKDVCCPVRYSCDHPEDELPLLDDMSTTVRPTPGFLLTTTTVSPVTQMTQDCVHNDQIIADGASITTEKACEHCYCMKGDIVCVVQECGAPMENEGKNCTSLPPREGQCCPDTYICEGDEPSTEVSTESATESILEKLTTLLPPRRGGVEGSGYRHEPNEAYTEIPTAEPELEGSGEEQEPTKSTSEHEAIITEKPQEISPIFEGDDQYIPVTTKAPIFEEAESTTKEIERNVIDDGDLVKETSEPEIHHPTTHISVEKDVDEMASVATESEELSQEHVTTASTLVSEKYDQYTTESGESLNTVPDTYAEKEHDEPQEFIPSTTSTSIIDENEPAKEQEVEEPKITTSADDQDILFTPISEHTSKPESSTTSPENVHEIEIGTTEKSHEVTEEIVDKESDISSTTSVPKVDEIQTISPETPESVSAGDISEEKDVTKPEQNIPSTTSTPSEDIDKLTTEPNHAQNTVDVAEDEGYPHVPGSIESEKTTVSELGDIVTEKVVKEDDLHEHITVEIPVSESKTTVEPDKGLNTIPSETDEESSSQPSLVDKTTASLEVQSTELPTIDAVEPQESDIKTPTVSEPSSTLADIHVTKVDPYTITTEPSFRKEDEISASTEKPKEEPAATTIKAEFVDEGLIPTSSHDDKIGTGSDISSMDEDVTTMSPEYIKEIDETVETKQPTTQSIPETSIDTGSSPEMAVEATREPEAALVPSTEKDAEVTVIPDVESHQEPSRIPGEGDCLLNSVTYKNNTVVPSTNICHTGCKCISSIIKCDPIICSPPPDYMDNCQSIYDTPDSCCPTYVCDHPRETIPPQSDNQMSGTEPPVPPPTIECRGDQCELSEPTKPTGSSQLCATGSCLPAADDKTTTQCGPEGCDGLVKEQQTGQPSVEHPECTDGKCEIPAEDCVGGKCELPVVSPPVKPCAGDDCAVTGEEMPASQLCENGNDCEKTEIPIIHTIPSHDGHQAPCKEEEGCQPQEVIPSGCTGEEPCRRVETPVIEQSPSKCQGSDCVLETEVAVTEYIQQTNTESSMPQGTSSEPGKEHMVVEEERPEQGIVTEREYTPTEHYTTVVTEKASEVQDIATEEPATDEKVVTKSPDAIEVYTNEPTIEISTEVSSSKAPDTSQDEQGTKIPDDVEKEHLTPDDTDKENANKLSSVDAEAEVTEEYVDKTTQIPDVIKKHTDEPTDEPGTRVPDVTEDNMEKSTKTPDIEIPVLDRDLDKKDPDAVEVSTNEPVVIKEDESETPIVEGIEHTEQPSSVQEQEPKTTISIDGVHTDKPITIEDEGTKIPDVTEEYNDKVTEKPDAVKEDTDESTSVVESETKVPDPLEQHTTETSFNKEEDSRIPDVLSEEHTDKPLSVEKETKIPDDVEETTDNIAPVEGEGTKIPELTENYSDEPTEVPVVIHEHSDEPIAIDESGTKIPDIVIYQTEEPVTVYEEGTKVPDHGEETSEKQPSINEPETEMPDTADKEPIDDVSSTEVEGINIPEVTEKYESTEMSEEDTKTTITSEEQNMKIPDEVIDKTDDQKLGVSVSDDTTEPSTDQEETTENNELIKESGTKKPIIIDDDIEGSTDEQPVGSEEPSTKPVVVEIDHTFTSVDEEHTSKPEKPEPTLSYQDEEHSGTKSPELLVTQSEILPEEHTKPYAEPVTLPQTSVSDGDLTTKPDIGIVDAGITEVTSVPVIITSESSDMKEPQSQDIDKNIPTESAPEILTEQEKTTKEPLDEKISQDTLIHVTDDGETKSPFEPATTPQESSTSKHEPTKMPEFMATTESVEKITISKNEETFTEQGEIYTDIPARETSAAESPGEEISKPQEGTQTKLPDSTMTESSKVPEEEFIQPASESHITDTGLGYESTSALPEPEIVKVTETPEIFDDETKKATMPEMQDSESEKTPTLIPFGTSEQDIKTDESDIFTPEKEQMITSIKDTVVTEPTMSSFTEIKDASITGDENPTTEYYRETTEKIEPAITIDASSVASPSTSETPSLLDVKTTSGPEELYTNAHEITNIPTVTETKPADNGVSDKSETSPTLAEHESTTSQSPDLSEVTSESNISEEPHRRTEITESNEIALETTELPIPELPVSIVTEPEKKPIDDVSVSEEKTTETVDLINLDASTLPPEISVTNAPTATEIPEAHITASPKPEESKATESSYTQPDITESQETGTKSEESDISIEKTTRSPEIPVKSEDSESDIETPLPGVQQPSTDYPATVVEIRTELPQIQVTTDKPQSLVTEYHQPDIEVTTKEQDYIESSLHETEPKPEEEITEKTDLTASVAEVTTSKQLEEVTKPTDQTLAQAEFSETTPYPIVELEEHTHRIQEDISTISPVDEKEHTYESEDVTSTQLPPSKEEHIIAQDITPGEEHLSTVSPSIEEYTQKITEEVSDVSSHSDEQMTAQPETEIQGTKSPSEVKPEEDIETTAKPIDIPSGLNEESSTILPVVSDQTTLTVPEEASESVSESYTSIKPAHEESTGVPPVVQDDDQKDITTFKPTHDLGETSAAIPIESSTLGSDIEAPTEKDITATEKPSQPHIHEASDKTPLPEDEIIYSTTKPTTAVQEDLLTPSSEDKYTKPEDKPTSEVLPPSSTAEVPKPPAEIEPEEIQPPEDDGHFPPSATGYGEPDYAEEDQAFGPGTCRYGGKVYVSAQQIPRDDPCDFCFCFRSDIICLQQSCPPPIHGCHEEPIQGFCCPRYECPVSMATTVNVTTTTTTTTTTLPPHFPTHSYKGAAQRRGCQIKGHTYKVGEVVRSSSGPCLHCKCGGDGQMKCDPKACTPEPMLRQMIAAAVSAKRRR